VNDIILAAPLESINNILKIFNSLHIRLQFTMEIGIDDRLSFLDTIFLIEEQSLVFNEYRKITFFGKFLNFNSPLYYKRGG